MLKAWYRWNQKGLYWNNFLYYYYTNINFYTLPLTLHTQCGRWGLIVISPPWGTTASEKGVIELQVGHVSPIMYEKIIQAAACAFISKEFSMKPCAHLACRWGLSEFYVPQKVALVPSVLNWRPCVKGHMWWLQNLANHICAGVYTVYELKQPHWTSKNSQKNNRNISM